MSEGWSGGGSRHETDPTENEGEGLTDLHETLVEAHRRVRQGNRSNRLQARDQTTRAVLDALLDSDEADRVAADAADALDRDPPEDVTESHLVVLLIRVGLSQTAPDIDELAGESLAEYVTEYEA